MQYPSAVPFGAPTRAAGKHSRAFTLVEVLVVVLILSILMAVALPLYLGAANESTRKTARSNLHMVVNAAQAYRLRSPTRDYPTALSDMIGDGLELNVPPKGPGDTQYNLYTGGSTLPASDGRTVPTGGVAACAKDDSRGELGDYGCFIPGADDNEETKPP